MKIDNIELTQSHIGRRVLRPAAGPWDKDEDGIITSWNERYVFVRYGRGDTSAATVPTELHFEAITQEDQ